MAIRLLEFQGVRVRETPAELKALIDAQAAGMASLYKDAPLGELPIVKAVRSIFHATGVDPTRYRPSSEALLRRAVKGKGLYFINSAVDVVNYFSLKTLLPMGLFDADRIVPPIEFRAGREGETYQGVGRDVLNLAGFPLLADAHGPFGSAVSDSVRTRVTEATTRLLWVTFLPPGAGSPPEFEEFAATMFRFNGGVLDKNTRFHTA
jgi:DNA/RNA-binding domain of Phe-tRNA-synthetase-like protein